MDITGEIHKMLPAQELKNNFTKREFVVLIDSGDQFPQYITFQLIKDRCEILDKFNEGDKVKIYFNLTGREWTSPEGNTKYFNSLVAWKIDGDGSSVTAKNNSTEYANADKNIKTPF